MSAYTYTTVDVVVTKRPCCLLGVTVSTNGGGPGRVEIYDAQDAEEPYKVATLLTGGNNSRQFTFQALELSRGLYVEIVEKADFVTVEWSPLDVDR